MRLELDAKNTRILHAEKEEIRCRGCGEENKQLYYCSQNEVLYCRKCHITGKACRAFLHEHIEWKIDKFKVITPPKHNLKLNMELIKDV